jgi:hypothetical protein
MSGSEEEHTVEADTSDHMETGISLQGEQRPRGSVTVFNISRSTSISERNVKVSAGVNSNISSILLLTLGGLEVVTTCHIGEDIICA